MRRLFWLLATVVAVPVAGAVYQKFSEKSDRRRHRKTGALVQVGSSTIYMYDVGPPRKDSTSRPTVLFESGIGATSQNWMNLQRAIAADYRAVSYERAGLGWSTGRSATPTPKFLSPELHHLLQASGIPGPYVMVAHSFGGLVARQFAADYPGEVLGLLLIDPMRPEDWPPFSETAKESMDRGRRLALAGGLLAQVGLSRLFMRSTLLGSGRIARFLCRLGGEHAQDLMDRMLCETAKMPREAWPAVVANWSRPGFYRTLESYLRHIRETVTAMHAAAPLDLPVVVLTPVSAAPLSEEQLQAISSNATQVIAPECAHWIHLDQPELVLREFHQFVTACTRI